ncbi:DUF418 domain-containing protein [Sphingomonas sp. BN140010]|uniref:DUF418 domain-containing protein n=1 Tax=Sphingomonas arvum TaxID=2992113 RepID=A0ABT3JGW1_9SPHN|nr:DUF418 domain-containing protein [Sphingomonas sp. BN140010]MCW3798317.1 DUF418 domain-containing protein [Sphingomonas sp. BN140010]
MASTTSERIFTLDVIRGVAVMGIFSVNVIAFAMFEGAYFNPGAYGGHTGADLFLWAANLVLVDGKMRSLFSMLFGASTLLVIERAEASSIPGAATHIRRMAVLLLFGLAHYYLVWFGDILVGYALVGLVAFLFRRRPAHQLFVLGCLFIVLNMVLFSLLVSHMIQLDHAAHATGATAEQVRGWNDFGRMFYPFPTDVAKDLALYRGSFGGRLHEMVTVRLTEPIRGTLFFGWETLGLMLLGMAAYKSGFLNGSWDDRSYRKVAGWCLGVGALAFSALAAADLASRFYVPTLFGGFLVATGPFRVAMAFGYAALIILLSRRMGPWSQRVAAAGRCAFSNYLGTSIVAAFVFYGWGLGLYGHVSRFEAWLLVPLVWLAMLLWSMPWLERFRYGPFEWAWRTLSRLQLQPMRKPLPT